jgi:hypothetical protein
MAPKPKADDSKKSPVKKPKMTQAEQSERFIQTAREFGADESGEKFEHALHKILPS